MTDLDDLLRCARCAGHLTSLGGLGGLCWFLCTDCGRTWMIQRPDDDGWFGGVPVSELPRATVGYMPDGTRVRLDDD